MATIRDNELILEIWNGSGIDGATFELSEYDITPGQPWEGISSISCDSGKCTMHVKAGRKGSKSVANWLKEKVAGGSASGGAGRWPDELNFAFMGTLTFWYIGNTYGGQNIVIGQGHAGGAGGNNNWWIGGANMSYFPGHGYDRVKQSFTKNNSAWADVIFTTWNRSDLLLVTVQ